MATTRKNNDVPSLRRPPATTPEGREDQLIAEAVGLAERQLQDGTASAQVITHFLKLGSTREKLEQERLRRENILLESRATALESGARIEELMKDAINAFRGYAGQSDTDERYEG